MTPGVGQCLLFVRLVDSVLKDIGYRAWISYKDVADARIDPLYHYLSSGASEERNPNCPFVLD
jgi:hypothetical protein